MDAIRLHTVTAALVAGVLLIPIVAAAEPPDLGGVWLWGEGENPTTMTLQQEGAKLTGRIQSGVSEDYWDVEGEVSDSGELSMIRLISKDELGGVPAGILAKVMERYGDATRPDFMRGPMRLTYDAAESTIRGQYSRINPFYIAATGTLVKVEEVWEDIDLHRAPPQPDLVVSSFVVEPIAGAGGATQHWSIRAEIVNKGYADMTQRFGARLEKLGPWGEGRPEKEFRAVAYSRTSHPALPIGEKTTLEWRTDTPTPTANRPNVTKQELALKVVVDFAEEIAELDEENNDRTAWKISCAGPDASGIPVGNVMWVEVPPTGAASTTPPDYSAILDKVSDPAQAVLCRIKLEAQRRARSTPGTSAGSNFVSGLKGHFLADYFADPTEAKGRTAIDAIGAHQGTPELSSYAGAAQYVPLKVRRRYPTTPTWLYPATEFWQLPVLGKGENITKIPLIDVPFLVGSENTSAAPDADFIGGGKNLSNVMHWATGVKYAHVQRDALRELFIGYELWHLEGWDKFGEDAINDLIAEEQGRMLGRRIRQASIRSEGELVQAIDEDFMAARAWVGAMLRLRKAELERLILADTPEPSNMWWLTSKARYVAPWKQNVSIKSMLADGKSVAQVAATGFAEQLTQIYTLIFEADEWERTHRGVGLTPTTRDIVTGKYDANFRAAPKPHGSEWELPE